MKVHTNLKELLLDFCLRLDLNECEDSEFSFMEVINPYLANNSLDLRKKNRKTK